MSEANRDESELSALLSGDFRAGAKALFDSLLYRAANNYHANPEIDAERDKENAIIREWAADALEDVSPDDAATWRSIENAYKAGFEAGKKAR